MIMSIADRMSKAQKIKMMPATEKDPESQREGLLKVLLHFAYLLNVMECVSVCVYMCICIWKGSGCG